MWQIVDHGLGAMIFGFVKLDPKTNTLGDYKARFRTQGCDPNVRYRGGVTKSQLDRKYFYFI